MRQGKQGQGHDTKTLMTALAPAIVSLVLMLFGTMATVAVMGMEVFRPKVGDMIVFRRALPDGDTWQLAIPAANVAGRGGSAAPCVMDPNVIAESGGSLIVEARENTDPLIYHLHWAGGHTALGAGDCGTQADLRVTRTELQKLANAAGGFGIGDKARMP